MGKASQRKSVEPRVVAREKGVERGSVALQDALRESFVSRLVHRIADICELRYP